MKNISPVLLLAFLLISKFLSAQCNMDDLADKCATQISDFKYIKSFDTDTKKEFEYVFSKDHSYLLAICDQAAAKGKMEVNLYDRNHKLVATNYNKQTKKSYPSINYKCSATGVYYIEVTFDDGGGCGVTVLAFKL
jgi:hypothetical protein